MRYAAALLGTLLALACATPAQAGDFTVVATSWPYALMGLAGGVAFLLYGLDKMTTAFTQLAGEKLRATLTRLTRTRLTSLATGMAITALVQSSAATTVMVVSFVSSRLMALPQALAVILGADIGTTITVQLIAFRLNQYALVAVAAGMLMRMVFPRGSHRWHAGRVVMAIGMVFFGIFLVGESMAIVKDAPLTSDVLAHMANPLVGLLAGAILTALMHSSAATMAIVIAMAGQGLVGLESALYLMLGANVGTSVTAGLASLNKSLDARRAAVAHFLFKLVGVVVVFPLVPWFAQLVAILPPQATEPGALPREVANAHTLFNLALAAIFLPFVSHMASWLTHRMPERRKKERMEPKFLDPDLLSNPALALGAARHEIVRIAEHVNRMMTAAPQAIMNGTAPDMHSLHIMEKEVDALYRQVIAFLAEISKQNLSEAQSQELMWLMNSTNHLENIGDIIGNELVEIGHKRLKRGVIISKPTGRLMTEMHADAAKALDGCIKALSAMDHTPALRVLPLKKDFSRKLTGAKQHQARRLVASEPNRVATYALEMDIIDKLQRSTYHTRKIAEETLAFVKVEKA